MSSSEIPCLRALEAISTTMYLATVRTTREIVPDTKGGASVRHADDDRTGIFRVVDDQGPSAPALRFLQGWRATMIQVAPTRKGPDVPRFPVAPNRLLRRLHPGNQCPFRPPDPG